MTTRTDTPQPGFYRFRMVRGGPYVGARIVRACCCTVVGGDKSAPHEWTEQCDRHPPLTCYVDGAERPENLQRVWLYGKPIDKAQYEFMVADAAWARDYGPEEPTANPTEAVDLKSLPVPF